MFKEDGEGRRGVEEEGSHEARLSEEERKPQRMGKVLLKSSRGRKGVLEQH